MMNVNKSIPGNMGIVRNALKGKTFSVIDWIVWIMVSVYPLFVLPTLGFAIPRYIMLALLSLFALFLLARVKLRVNHPSFVAFKEGQGDR
jgi:apolipoprotein N-acyltransferase